MSDIDRHMRSKDKPNNLSLDLSLNLKPCLKLNSSEKGLNKYCVFWLRKNEAWTVVRLELKSQMKHHTSTESRGGMTKQELIGHERPSMDD